MLKLFASSKGLRKAALNFQHFSCKRFLHDDFIPEGLKSIKGGDPSAGSPTDTLLQLSPPRGILNRLPSKRTASSKPHSAGLMGGVCKTQGLIHRAIVTRDYWGFHLHEGGLQPSIRTEDKFLGLPYLGLRFGDCLPLSGSEPIVPAIVCRVLPRAFGPYRSTVAHSFLSVTTAVSIECS